MWVVFLDSTNNKINTVAVFPVFPGSILGFSVKPVCMVGRFFGFPSPKAGKPENHPYEKPENLKIHIKVYQDISFRRFIKIRLFLRLSG
jgi:hypothetical protein